MLPRGFSRCCLGLILEHSVPGVVSNRLIVDVFVRDLDLHAAVYHHLLRDDSDFYDEFAYFSIGWRVKAQFKV